MQNRKPTPVNTSQELNQLPRRCGAGARRRRAVGGFSLVEVTLAIGIIAFAMVPLLGLLPTGMNMQRRAIENTTLAQIHQVIVGDLQRAEFSQLVNSGSSGGTGSGGGGGAAATPKGPFYWYFDDRGVAVDAANASRLYDAQAQLFYPVALPADTGGSGGSSGSGGSGSGSGSGEDGYQSYSLIRATIRIAFNPGRKALNTVFDPAQPTNYETRFAMIVKGS